VGVDHGGLDVLVTHELLHDPNVVPRFQQVRGEGMPECVAADRLRDARPSCRILDRPLQGLLVDVVAHPPPGIWVLATIGGREHELPRPRIGCLGVLSRQCLRQRGFAETLREIVGMQGLDLLQMLGQGRLEALLNYIDNNVDFVEDYCIKMIPEIIPVKPEATYMIWLDCRKLGMNGKELQNFFVNSAGIGMNEGSTFGPGGEGFMRMNLGTTHQIVMKAMEQIEKAVASIR